MKLKVSELIDYTLKGKYFDTIKFKNTHYYFDEDNRTYINIYGVNLWVALIGAVESGCYVGDLELEVFS